MPSRVIELIRQEQSHGCGIACLAMLLGRSYADVLADWPLITEDSDLYEDGKVVGKTKVTYNDFGKSGTDHMSIDSYLAKEGYAVARRYKHRSNLRRDDVPWPPEPFADVHLCEVKTSSFHFIIMLGDGEVLDPHFGRGRRLSDYSDVYSVAGVYKSRRHASA